MPYDGVLLARARSRLESRRADNQAQEQRRREEVYARIPEVERIDRQLRRQMGELLRLTIGKKPDMAARLQELRRANLDLQAHRGELLHEAGYPVEYLEPIYSCPICKDSGMDGMKPCRCLETLYNQELTKELGSLLRTGEESFDRFDLKLYSDQPDPVRGVVPREAMALILSTCRRYADNFPHVSSNLLFQGGTGLGKTYLSACIARVVADKGCSLCYDSAVQALDAFERQKFAQDPEESAAADAKVRRMLSCDLMILDDLGTEMLTPMAKTALYTLLEERLTHKKRSIISTNLSDGELRARYTPQICSRLEGEFVHLPFIGSDIRLMKR